MRYSKVNTVYKTETFKVTNTAGTAQTGRAGSITSTLYASEVSSAQTVTVSELGSTGVYYASFTPNALGLWDLILVDPTYNVAGWHDAVQAMTWATLDDTAVDGITLAQAVKNVWATTTGNDTGEPSSTALFAGPSGTNCVSVTYDANNNRTTVAT